MHAFIGDSSNGQPPMTVIIPSDILHATNAVQVPTVARLPDSHAASAAPVVDAIRALDDELRKSHEEAEVHCQKEVNKTPRDHFGPKTETLLRLCQVACE
jgi:hypothetical protein